MSDLEDKIDRLNDQRKEELKTTRRNEKIQNFKSGVAGVAEKVVSYPVSVFNQIKNNIQQKHEAKALAKEQAAAAAEQERQRLEEISNNRDQLFQDYLNRYNSQEEPVVVEIDEKTKDTITSVKTENGLLVCRQSANPLKSYLDFQAKYEGFFPNSEGVFNYYNVSYEADTHEYGGFYAKAGSGYEKRVLAEGFIRAEKGVYEDYKNYESSGEIFDHQEAANTTFANNTFKEYFDAQLLQAQQQMEASSTQQ